MSFKDVSLGYKDFQSTTGHSIEAAFPDPFVKSLNFELKHGEKMCVLGSSGSGKSTIFKALNGYFNNFCGTIQIHTDSARPAVNSVLQGGFLFEGTIRDNLNLGTQDLNDVFRILQQLELEQTVSIADLSSDQAIAPEKYSSGQNQMLNFARAVIANPSVLLLDESTSDIDPRNERLIYDYLRSHAKDMSVVSVIHKTDHIREYDKVFVMKQGTLELAWDAHVQGPIDSESLSSVLKELC